MIITDDILKINPALEYADIAKNEQVLFFDIETTGFSANSTELYLIGCIYRESCVWKMRQWFVENHNEEKECLTAFGEFIKKFTTLIHFNGNGFDIPYLTKKYERYKLKIPFNNLKSVDIYKALMPCKKFLSMENLKQKSVEKLLGIDREDKFSGGELIYVYFDYLEHRRNEALNLLLLHNKEDLIGMTYLLPALAYSTLKNPVYISQNSSLSSHRICTETSDGRTVHKLLFEFITNFTFPTPIKAQQPQRQQRQQQQQQQRQSSQNITVLLSGNSIRLLIPITTCELKYFYPNYKDYFYLPVEDVALHKSVAMFVDKNYRTQAKAANCYTKKSGDFIPLPGKTPDLHGINIFRSEYSSKELYLDLDEVIKNLDNHEFALSYLNNLLSLI